MSEKRFVCIDVGYGDEWYITDNGERLSEMEIVDLLNNLNDENEQLRKQLEIRTESDKYHQRMLLKWLCKDE